MISEDAASLGVRSRAASGFAASGAVRLASRAPSVNSGRASLAQLVSISAEAASTKIAATLIWIKELS